MANQCCVCKKKFGFLDTSHQIVSAIPSHHLCDDCHSKREALIRSTGEEFHRNYAHFQNLLTDNSLPIGIRNYFIEISEQKKKQEALLAKAQARQEAYEQRLKDMMLTTGSNFEGYTVTKYVDVICEEIIFKNSFLNRLSAGIEDFVDKLSFKEKEMSGSVELIARARSYVMDKFRRKVASIGANAALGVEFESSIGTDIIRVAIFGTAVVIEKSL